VCDEIPSALREVRRTSAQEETTLLGWCIGGTLSLLHCALEPDTSVRNLVLLTTPIDTTGSLYSTWVARDSFDVDRVADVYGAVPGRTVDWANKLMKPVTNYWTTYRRLWQQVLDGEARRDAYQSMAKWVADNPPFPGRAYREWITWMYKENRLVRGRMRLRERRARMSAVEQNLLVVTAGADHIAPREGTLPVLDQVASADVTHLDRPGGHIGLMAGSKARKDVWPEIAEWLAERSDA
jgi:polyhydroxyalkanoate synthase